MPHTVRRLDLIVTEACNLACPYCFGGAAPRLGSMSTDVARRAVSWLLHSEADRLHITFWGGEPLLRLPLLREVAALARRAAAEAGKALSLSLPTNATLLDDDALRWIEEADVRVFLSIDGDAETQADRPLATGGSSHALARRGLELALRRRPGRAPVRITMTPANVGRLAHNVAYFWDLGVREVLTYPALDGEWPAEALATCASEQLRLADELVSRLERADHPSAAPVLRAWMPALRRLLPGAEPRPPRGPLHDCGVGRELVALGVEGRFSACHRFMFYERARGAVRDLGDLDVGLRVDGLRAFRDVAVEELLGEKGRCVDCDIFDLCSYGCLAINYATSGSLTRVPAVACELQRGQVEACRQVHERLGGDPRFASYLGRPLAASVRAMADRLGRRAWRLYHRSQ